MSHARPLRTIALTAVGLIIWSICFVVLYAALSLGCAAGLHEWSLFGVRALNVILGCLWLVHFGLLGSAFLVLWRTQRQAQAASERFLVRLTCMLIVVGSAATLWVGFPVLLLPACA